MDYTLHEISEKMGLPDFPERKEMLYYYHNPEDSKLGGYAEIRLEDQNRLLTASLYHCRENYEDDNGVMHERYEETVQINACRMGSSDTFRIIHMTLDNTDYAATDDAMVELGLAVFHSRIIDVNLGMVEQTFDTLKEKRQPKENSFKKQDYAQSNTVVPFPSRASQLTV